MCADDSRSAIEIMRSNGWLEYGKVIDAAEFLLVLGISYPATGTREEFKAIELEELSSVDFIRTQMIQEGKYLKRDGSSYRILLVSENIKQIEKMINSADKRLRKAIKLHRHTPTEATVRCSSDIIVRAEMKRQSITSFVW